MPWFRYPTSLVHSIGKFLPITALTVAAAAAGWLCGGWRSSPPSTTSKNASAARLETDGRPLENRPSLERFRAGFSRIEATFLTNGSTSEMSNTLLAEASGLRTEDFPGAIVTALNNNEKSLRECAFYLAALWAENDPLACRKWIMSLPSVTTRQEFMKSTGDVLARVAPSEFLDWFSGLAPLERQRMGTVMVNAIADAAAGTDPERGVSLVLEQGTFSENLPGLRRLFTALAKTDPARAAERATKLPGGPALSQALSGVVQTWAENDPAAARAWLATLDDAMLATHATAAFAEGLATRDPRAAVQMVAELPGMERYQETLGAVVRTWGGKDAPSALAWIESLPEAERSALAASALADQVEKRPAEVLDQLFARPKLVGYESALAMGQALENIGSSPEPWLSRLPELPESLRGPLIESGLQTWAVRDPGPARAWAANQKEDSARQTAYSALARASVKNDREEFPKWVNSLPKGSDRDAALFSGAAEMLRYTTTDRIALFEMMNTASDRETAHRWVRQFAGWDSSNPKLAQWLDATPLLNNEEKAALRAQRGSR